MNAFNVFLLLKSVHTGEKNQGSISDIKVRPRTPRFDLGHQSSISHI